METSDCFTGNSEVGIISSVFFAFSVFFEAIVSLAVGIKFVAVPGTHFLATRNAKKHKENKQNVTGE